jgi:phosphoribosyl 1,2-cyclic phosphodiesterase
MKLKVLGSSSKGNCYILKSPTGSLLLECGLPWPQIQKGLDFDLSKVRACIISHEHKDHSKAALDVIKAGIDLYASKGTIDALSIPYQLSYRAIPAHIPMQINFGDFTVLSFVTEHDAADPRGFLIKYRPTGEKLLFLTDSYYSKYKFSGLNAILIECNYIKETLDANIEAGLIDERMKPRLLQSHFSLEHVKEFLQANDLSQVREIILLHLSDANSDAARMIREIKEVTGITPKIAAPELAVDLELYPY